MYLANSLSIVYLPSGLPLGRYFLGVEGIDRVDKVELVDRVGRG